MRVYVIAAVVLGLWNVHAQTPPTALTFEVASIRPSAPDFRGMFYQPQPGGLRVVAATVKDLIYYAYGVQRFSISGGPGWVDSDRFDINARFERSSPVPQEPPGEPGQKNETQPRASFQQLRECLKSLLTERFQLKVHNESKEQRVYVLAVADNGPKFSDAKPESENTIRRRNGTIIGKGTSLQMLAVNLASSLDRPVLDRTALTGRYDFELKWTPEAVHGSGSTPAAGTETPLASDPGDSSLFTALREQLGLRIEVEKAPVETLVIDRVAKPTEN